MYKVFFNERIISIGSDFKNFLLDNSLFYKVSTFVEAETAWKSFLNDPLQRDMFLVAEEAEKGRELFWGLFKFIEAAGGVVTNKNDQLLVISRWGKWDLPKGKAEENEKPQETAIREVEEECGISGLINSGFNSFTWHIYEHPHKPGLWILKQTWWYNMKYYGEGELIPQIKEDIIDARWFSKSELEVVESNTWASLIPIFRSFIDSEQIS